MLIFQCILGLQSQIIDFINAFSQVDIPIGESLFVKLTKYLNIYRVKFDVVIILKKNLYGQAKAARIRYEKLQVFIYIVVLKWSRFIPDFLYIILLFLLHMWTIVYF